MVEDAICGMEVDPRTAEWTSEYLGRTYYFCSHACKEQFDADPALYIDRGSFEVG